MQTMPEEDSLSKPLESALGEGPARSNLALDMTLKVKQAPKKKKKI